MDNPGSGRESITLEELNVRVNERLRNLPGWNGAEVELDPKSDSAQWRWDGNPYRPEPTPGFFDSAQEVIAEFLARYEIRSR
jgi:hypothetical protein